MSDKNIEYYNENAQSFYDGTVNVDMSLWRDKFEHYVLNSGATATTPQGEKSSLQLATGKKILDAGCGSGRDSLAFKKHGYLVVAFDASSEMCRMASALIGQEVLQMRFDEVTFADEFDGIWACASLLHVPGEELPETLGKLRTALKDRGALYVSFKYGEGSKQRGERVFSDFTEESVKALLSNAGFDILECGMTSDIRPGRSDEKWVNVIARKQ